MKTIGLIGGMSWESSAHYYAILNRETARRRGGLHSAPVLMHSLDFAPIASLQLAGEWEQAAILLSESAVNLVAAGAEIIAIATNTMHIVADQVAASLDVPFVHIADPTARALRQDGMQKVGLLGTRFTMEMSFYKDRLISHGLEPMVPDHDHTNLNGIIYDELCHGIVRDSSRDIYVSAIERMAARGAEAVILGCTEIGMLVSDETSPLPVYDTTRLHAIELVDIAMTS